MVRYAGVCYFGFLLCMYTHGRINEDERKHERDPLTPEIQQTLKF